MAPKMLRGSSDANVLPHMRCSQAELMAVCPAILPQDVFLPLPCDGSDRRCQQ